MGGNILPGVPLTECTGIMVIVLDRVTRRKAAFPVPGTLPVSHALTAAKARAHKLARAWYHILKESKPFHVTRCFA
jgi:hypothetical protein